MQTECTTVPAQPPRVSNQSALFGRPPLLTGEDSAAYNDLLARVTGHLKPTDIFEEIWAREIVDLIWET